MKIEKGKLSLRVCDGSGASFRLFGQLGSIHYVLKCILHDLKAINSPTTSTHFAIKFCPFAETEGRLCSKFSFIDALFLGRGIRIYAYRYIFFLDVQLM